MELIPAIDLQEGRCVRLFQGDFAAQTVYSNEPAEVLSRYLALGAQRVHVVDLDGARDGQQRNRAVIDTLATGPAQLQVGGGVRTLDRARNLLQVGVERVVIGSLAVTDPAEVLRWMTHIDPQRMVLALDVRMAADGTPLLTTHGWQQTSQTSLWQAAAKFAAAGLGHVLCTDISRDGALSGPNFELYAEAVQRFPGLQWQASGGVSCARDLHLLRECGVAAVISGKALLENRIATEELRPFLPSASSPVSM